MDIRSLLLIGLLASVVYGGVPSFETRIGTQEVVGICIRDDEANTVQLELRVESLELLSTLDALDSSNDETACTIIRTDAAYSVTSTASLVNQGASEVNPCAYRRLDMGTSSYTDDQYQWVFYYHELSGRKDVDIGLNRNYSITCNTNNMVNNRINASVEVYAPNLNEIVTPHVPDVKMYIMIENGQTNTFSKATANQRIKVGTRFKLRLELKYGTFDPNKPYGVTGKLTVQSPFSTFSTTQVILDNNGCPDSSNIRSPANGYSVTSNGVSPGSGSGIYAVDTSAMTAWRPQFSQFLYFRSFIFLCRAPVMDSLAACQDVCASSIGRRRRDVESDEPEEMNVRIEIYDDEDSTEFVDSEDMTGLLVGVSVAAVVILIVLVLAVCVVVTRRRKQRRAVKKMPPQRFENKMAY